MLVYYGIFFFFVLVVIFLGYQMIVYYFVRVPYLGTPKERFALIFDYIFKQEKIKKSAKLVDLGCGYGRVLFEAEHRGMKNLTGFELSPLYLWWGKLLSCFYQSRVRLERKNFMQEDLSVYDVIYIFLTSNALPALSVKLKKEAKKGALIIILGQKLPNFSVTKDVVANVKKNIHLYF